MPQACVHLQKSCAKQSYAHCDMRAATPLHTRCFPHLCREMEAAAKRASQQQELLNSRIAELDAESRKLRDQKYQLDTQVRCSVVTSTWWP